MALATTCPQCKTSFRVVPDQLKLRRGFVRCGRCRNVFAGIDHLRYVDEAQLRAEAQARADAERPAETEDDARTRATVPDGDTVRETGDDAGLPHLPRIDADEDVEYVIVDVPDPEPPAGVPPDAVGPHSVGPPLLGPHADGAVQFDDARGDGSDRDGQADTSIDEASSRLVSPVPDDAVEAHDDAAVRFAHEDAAARFAHEEAVALDERLDDDAEGETAIDYFSTRRSRGFADRRGIAVAFGVLALAFAFALQFVIAQRATIAARAPALAPILGAALAPFGLRIGAPSDLDALTIESFELQASADPDVLEMRALLRNRADHPVRWPSMQLTLTDRSDRVLVRRNLDPDDYLREAGTAAGEGVPARTEWPLQLALEARDLHLAGYDYRVRLFYP